MPEVLVEQDEPPQELQVAFIEAIDFGQVRIWFFTIGLTLLCIVLYIPWRRLRRQNAV
jgi:hypothetical protein